MAEASVENRSQISLENDGKEANFAKRMKKEPGAVTGKSVVVLRSSDVTRNSANVFMPNTIEMAQLKKPDKGQFKTDVQISSKMTEKDIQKTLVETFPILRHQRFYCAAAVDNRSRLDFHGEQRIWDGHSIKRRIKGNSALYILIEETRHEDGKLDPQESEPLTLKRSHDQMVTNEQYKKSISDLMPEETPSRLSFHHVTFPGFEGQTEHGNPLIIKRTTNYPVVVSGPTPTVVEKNDDLQPSEKQLRHQEGLDKLPAMQSLVFVPSEHMLPPVCCSSTSMHSVSNTRGVVSMATSSLPRAPSFPMGAIMVPAGGIVLAQPGPIVSQAISTVTDNQSLGRAVLRVAKGSDVWQTGMQIPPQAMVSSTLTPQMNSLNISNATFQQSQKPVIAEKSVAAKKDQNIQTDGTETLQQDSPMKTLAQSNRSLPVKYSNKMVPLAQNDSRFKPSADQFRQPCDDLKTNSSQIMEKGSYGTTASMATAAAVDRHRYRPAVLSGHESLSSDQTDSGIETTDNTREVISQAGESYLDVAKKALRHTHNQVKPNEAEWSRPGIEGGAGLSLLTAAMEIREQKSIVEDICPKSSSVRGGIDFILILNEHLPADLEVGFAYFGNSDRVALRKVNEFNLSGIIPAYQVPGTVTVKLMSSTNSCLGETSFDYIDEVDLVLRQLVHDTELQARFFNFWAQGLRHEMRESEKQQSSQPTSNIKTASTRLHQLVLRLFGLNSEIARRFFLCWVQGRGNETSEKNEVNESDYDADDERSSSDSSEDGNMLCNKDGCLNSESLLFNAGMTYSKERETRDSDWELPSSKHVEKQSNSQLAIQTFVNQGNINNQEQANGQMMFLVFRDRLYNNPNTSINENLDNLPFHAPESEARTIELETSACPNKREEAPNGAVCDNRAGARDNSEAKSNNTSADIIDKERSYVDFDQNSVADKTSADERNSDKTDDSPGDPL